MKKTLTIMTLSALATILSAAPENPVTNLFEKDITFSINFDDGTTNADMANGKAAPKRFRSKTTEIAPTGLFGKALLQGRVEYDAALNLDLTQPGTLIYWIAPVKWSAEKPANGKEPGFNAFYGVGRAKEYGFELISGKMGGQPWGHGHFNTYVQYMAKPRIKHVNCVTYNKGRTSTWKNGTWKMIAVTWSGGKFAVSIDGELSRSSALNKLMTGKTNFFILESNGSVMLDEVTILNRALSDTEIKKLYDAVMKVRNTK
ncbi:MAG: hypothetical protein IKB16_11880 [Lentisphaeria bacterium]|nr:hypothetical protein [Lentisphaeria bacterium]